MLRVGCCRYKHCRLASLKILKFSLIDIFVACLMLNTKAVFLALRESRSKPSAQDT